MHMYRVFCLMALHTDRRIRSLLHILIHQIDKKDISLKRLSGLTINLIRRHNNIYQFTKEVACHVYGGLDLGKYSFEGFSLLT